MKKLFLTTIVFGLFIATTNAQTVDIRSNSVEKQKGSIKQRQISGQKNDSDTKTGVLFQKNDQTKSQSSAKKATAATKKETTPVKKEVSPAKQSAVPSIACNKRFAIKPHINIGLGDVYKVIGENIGKQSSSTLEFGLDFGYNFYSNQWISIYAYLGIGVEKGSIKIEQNGLNYEYETNQDVDGDTYIRKYKDVNTSQELSLNDFTLPVFVEVEYPIPAVKRLCAYGDLGIRASFPGKSSVKSVSGSYKVTGLYRQYGDMELGPSSGINGFTNNGVLSESNVASYNIERDKSSVKLFCQLGLRYKVWNELFIDVACGYLHSFKSTQSSSSEISDNYPLHYDVQTGETFNAFANESKHLINKFSINVGIMYKF